MKLLLTEAEFSRLSNVFDKLMKQRAKLTENEWKKDVNKVVKQLAGKFAPQTMPTEQHEVHLDRRQLRFIEAAVKQSVEVLEQRVLPEYEKRDGDMESYKANVRSMIELYKSIQAKVGAVL